MDSANDTGSHTSAWMSFLLLSALFAGYAFSITIPNGSFYLDGGWAANIANQLVHGKVLYRDISASYGPVLFELYRAIFELFGKGFLQLRLVGLALILVQGTFLFATARLVLRIVKTRAPCSAHTLRLPRSLPRRPLKCLACGRAFLNSSALPAYQFSFQTGKLEVVPHGTAVWPLSAYQDEYLLL